MNKSKFKAVRFKPFDLELKYLQRGDGSIYWTNNIAFGNSVNNDVYFTDPCIEAYPELFEVEKAEREFENYKFYKAKFYDFNDYEVVQCINDCFYRNGNGKGFILNEFFEIGEKIEL